ncbi:hypothetical protein SUGI_0945010 [Cryptomeria japonica]|nr:hypothetical protein SUGI_0945010 [Cryptomeria japonica]
MCHLSSSVDNTIPHHQTHSTSLLFFGSMRLYSESIDRKYSVLRLKCCRHDSKHVHSMLALPCPPLPTAKKRAR